MLQGGVRGNLPHGVCYFSGQWGAIAPVSMSVQGVPMRSVFPVSVLVASLAFPVAAQTDAAPGLFGIDHGVTHDDEIFSDFQSVEIDEPGVIALAGKNPPRPHSAFDTYFAKFHPDQGICWGKALSDDFESDRYGSQVRSAVDEVAEQISKRYGEPQKVDRLSTGSIWRDAEDWASGLHRNERFYYYQWDDLALGNNITSIFLVATSAGFSDTRMALEWSFTTKAACDALVEQEDTEAF